MPSAPELVVAPRPAPRSSARAGRFAEIGEEAILGLCGANRPAPLYKPRGVNKKRLALHGWIP